MTRAEAIQIIARSLHKRDIMVFANGYISKEGIAYAHRALNFYMLMSMGHASTIALGLALSFGNKRKVVCIDGDANLLMNLGALVMIVDTQPKNFLHVVLDNQVHGTTGCQRSQSDKVLLEKVALAVGYSYAQRVNNSNQLQKSLRLSANIKGPIFILVSIEKKNAPAPLFRMPMVEIKKQFMKNL